MIFYELDRPGGGDNRFFPTLAEAHKEGKQFPYLFDDMTIKAVEVAADKDGILKILNGAFTSTTKRYWIFTKRGGIVETDRDFVPLKNGTKDADRNS